jgi:O-antigen ligase
LGLILVAVGLLQLLPIPRSVAHALAAPIVEARESVALVTGSAVASFAPGSLSPPATLDAALRLLAYVLVGLAAVHVLSNRRDVKRTVVVIVVAGVLQAVYGSAEYLTGHQHIFAYEKQHYLDSATGTFVNRNHFAGYLAACLPLALAGVLSRPQRQRAKGWKDALVRLGDPAVGRFLAYSAAAVLILIGILLSYSRGGLAAALIGVAFLVLNLSKSRRRLALVLALLLAPAIILCWQEVRAPGARFITDTTEIASLNSRVPVWRTTIGMLPSHMPLGTGFGTFEDAFRLNQPAELGARWTHAHNDWLQVALEGGALALLVVLLMLLVVFGSRLTRAPVPTESSTLRAAALAGIAAIVFHSLIDFPLRIPAVPVLLVTLVAVTAVTQQERAPAASPRHRDNYRVLS